MKKICSFFLKVFVALLAFIGVTFTIYYTNSDMKLVKVIYDKLQPYYDNLKKDRKL